MTVNKKIVFQCKEKLLQTKAEILNRMKESKMEHDLMDRKGDETDAAMSLLAENQFLSHQTRLRTMLLEIETALARIERGIFGICEETEEPIEAERLLAIPWTRLSIEGAELRDELDKRYAKS